MSKYYFGQDGEIIDSSISSTFELSSSDFRVNSKINSNIFDFVGVVVKDEKQLIVFPKHMYTVAQLQYLNKNPNEGIKGFEFVISAISKYIFSTNSRSKGSDFSGSSFEIIDSSYPFEAFFSIYEYYEKYGIFSQRKKYISENGNGRYNWKSIIEKSQPYLTNNGIVFSPLYKENISDEFTFLSEAMAFVINETLDKFSYILPINPITNISYNHQMFEDKDYVLLRLSKILKNTYKDIDINLIENIILFFEEDEEVYSGIDEHIKINYFNLIWQEMVHHYLNRHLNYVTSSSIDFSVDVIQRNSPYFKVLGKNVDDSANKWSISIDHYHIDDEHQLIFDSKYYDRERELNYKQIAYHEFMTKLVRERGIVTISALIFPGIFNVDYHFKTSDAFLKKSAGGELLVDGDEVIIYSIKLDMLDVINDYLLT